jgi:hypothetical protein
VTPRNARGFEMNHLEAPSVFVFIGDSMTYDKVCERHAFWCGELEQFAQILHTDTKRPSLVIDAGKGGRAGYYSAKHHRCHYAASYIVQVGEKYDEVIAHECCHAYQKALMPHSKWHGEFFFFLLQVVCGFKHAKRCHNYNVKQAKAAQKLLKMAEKLRRLQ